MEDKREVQEKVTTKAQEDEEVNISLGTAVVMFVGFAVAFLVFVVWVSLNIVK